MKIAYLWIENYKNIECQGFNFDSEISIEIISYYPTETHAEYTLEFIVKDTKIKKSQWLFSENITNISAIVGENGAGKTSIMEFLFNEVGNPYSNYPYILILKNNRNTYLIYRNICGYSYENPDKVSIRIKNDEEINFKFDKIFYSNLFDYNISLNQNEHHNLTTAFYVNNINRNIDFESHSYNHVDLLRVEELNIQIDFIGSRFSKKLPFEAPRQINIGINTQQRLSRNDKFLFYQKENNVNLDKLYEIEDFLFPNYERPVNLNIANWLLYDLISIIMWQSVHNNQAYNSIEFPNFQKDWTIDVIVEYFKLIQKSQNYDINNNNFKYKIDFLLYLRDNEISEVYYISPNSISIFKTFINRYSKAIQNTRGFIDFSWHQISSGERAMINLFSRLYSIHSEVKHKNIILFLDEAETGFHPLWQKQLISIINDFLPKLFSEKNIQIFLTSHSPYILSDLPRENIVFLKRKNNKCHVDKGISHNKTFGANILDLFSDAFFLDSTIGAFAMEKIQKAISIALEDRISELDWSYAQYIADIIGDDVISYKLKKILDKNVANNRQ